MNRYQFSTTLALILCGIPAILSAQGHSQNALCVNGQATLCSTLPVDLPNLTTLPGYSPSTNAATEPSSNVTQDNFDWFGWQMFIALNWPADATGNPLPGRIGKNPAASRVWQSLQSPDQVFPGNNLDPSSCAADKTGLVLRRTSKFSTDSFIEPGDLRQRPTGDRPVSDGVSRHPVGEL
jgi:hypothetical protein